MVAQTDLEAEQLLDEIHRQREVVREERTRAGAARAAAEEAERELARRLDDIEDERRRILDQTRTQAGRELDTLREELSELKLRLAKAAQPLEALEAVEAVLDEAEALHALPVAPLTPVKSPGGRTRAVRLGDTVKLKALNSVGVVTALTALEAEVQVGRLRVRAKLEEVELRGSADEGPKPEVHGPRPQATSAPSPGLELDIRGKTVEEALPEIEHYLDAAYLAGLPWVRIIHGKGTGKLRQGVRDHLRTSPVVKSHETGRDEEGGEGVTVVRLAVEG
jgi:DNA mismatch repair protein MutS2